MAVRKASMGPLAEKNRFSMPTSTTMEMKWGAYRTVWANFLRPGLFTSLSISERMMGMGKPAAMEYRERTTVFLIRVQA